MPSQDPAADRDAQQPRLPPGSDVRAAAWRASGNRGADRAHIGTTLREPNIDYAKMAQAYGMYGEGPIADPKDLAPAIKRALDRVKRGEPALVDVITQPR